MHSIPLNLMSFEEFVELAKKVQELTSARLPEAVADAEQRLTTLRAIAGVRPETAPKKKERKTRAVKTYRNPETGETYSKGKHPQWLKDALDAGRSKDEFLVHSSGV